MKSSRSNLGYYRRVINIKIIEGRSSHFKNDFYRNQPV